MKETELPKRVNLRLEADQITNDYVKIAQNSCNMIAFIASNLQSIPFDEIPTPPTFNHTNFGEINYVGDKKIYLDLWLYNHGVNDIIKGVNLSLARANYFSDLISLKGKTMTVAGYKEFEKKTNKKYLKKDLPALINLTRNLVTQPLIYTDKIISINNVRKCLEHRIGKVTEIDAKTTTQDRMTLDLKWIGLKVSVIKDGVEVIIDKPGMSVSEGEEIVTTFENKVRKFEIGEYVRISLEEFYQLAFTGFLFIKHIADNYNFKQ